MACLTLILTKISPSEVEFSLYW